MHFETSNTSPKVEITGRDDGSGIHKGENGYITVPLLKNLVGIRGTATTSPYALYMAAHGTVLWGFNRGC